MNLLDLPDEMLLCILNEIHAVDALGSLSHLHPWLDSVLLRIDDKVTQLILTLYAMERVLGPVHYPRRSSLSLVSIPQQQLVEHLEGTMLPGNSFVRMDYASENAVLHRLPIVQITHLNDRVDDQIKKPENLDPESSAFESILLLCEGVTNLTNAHRVTIAVTSCFSPYSYLQVTIEFLPVLLSSLFDFW